MPITVSCPCGKSFKVKDDMVGKAVKCQVCGQSLTVAAEAEAAPVPEVESAPAQNGETKICPACAESIPKKAMRCPLCKEDLSKSISTEDQAAALANEIAAIEAHAGDADKLEADDQTRGGFLSVKSMVIIGIEALGIISIAVGVMGGRHMEGFSVIGTITVVLFTIPVIVTLLNDKYAQTIQTVPTPDAAFRRYFTSVRTSRYKPAFAALSPSARVAKNVQSIKFKNAKIPSAGGRYSIGSPESFGAYWKTVFRGPSGTTRTLSLKSVHIVKQTEDEAIVEATVNCTSYPSWIVIAILVNLLVVLILYVVMRTTETKTFRKVLVRRNGRWFVLEPGLEGPLDSVQSSALTKVNSASAATAEA